jgi:hypothetical protein
VQLFPLTVQVVPGAHISIFEQAWSHGPFELQDEMSVAIPKHDMIAKR